MIWRRYGGFVDYVRDVRAWGDGQSFQWILRLDGGGVGVRLDGRQVRIGVQAGAEWKAQLDVLLRATQASAARIPVLDVPGVALGVEEAVHLRLLAQEKALPARGILRQLAARLSRWRDREEDSAMSGSLYRLLLPDPGLRLFVVEGRSAVEEARARHQLTAGSTLPLGRALMGASLLAWDAKSGHRITLQFKSQGPIGGVVADARPDGSVRGYVHVPQLAFPIADVRGSPTRRWVTEAQPSSCARPRAAYRRGRSSS